MDTYKKLAIIKNLIKNHYFLTQRVFYSTTQQQQQQQNMFPENEILPYTRSLYKKNYMKYNNQSIQKTDHDYVFSPAERLPTLEERLKDFVDPNDKRSTINIGYSIDSLEKEKKENVLKIFNNNKNDKNLEKLAHTKELKVPLDIVNNDYREIKQLEELKSIAEHYNLFKDLFDCGYFYPILNLNIKHEFKNNDNKNEFKNIYYGNKLNAIHTNSKPLIDLNNLKDDKYYTLTFMNLDGSLNDNNSEVLLWFLSNINKEKNLNGNELFNYLAPFPMKGTGWHRCVYVLYEHNEPIDYFNEYFNNNNDKNLKKHELELRKFKTLDFYMKMQDKITPVSFLFFQSQWDHSVKNTFHNVLNMKEPIYEYDFGKKFVPTKEKYPKNAVFNWYIEEYKDVKDLNEQVLKEYISKLSPLDDYPEPLIYPGIEYFPKKLPRWYKYEVEDYINRRQKWNIVPFKYSSLVLAKKNYLKSLPYQIHEKYQKFVYFKEEKVPKAEKDAATQDKKKKK